MSTWIYQINPEQWPPERYRLEIWEGERWCWPVGKKLPAKQTPKPGDVVVFFYSRGRGKGTDPGFYGWAIILEWYGQGEGSEIYFRPVAPSDLLKMHPWSDETALSLADEIRGPIKQGTMWLVRDELVPHLRAGICEWLGGLARRRSKR